MMDVSMPSLDGFSAARQLMNDPTTKGIPVVFVTSKDQKADRVFAQMLGAKGFVTKPYTPNQIFSAI
jgi:twitching motility two-component system response regulator PilH